MSQAIHTSRLLPLSTLALLSATWVVVALFGFFGDNWLATPLSAAHASLIFAMLFSTIVAASFGVVREADHLAHELGEPYGTLILTLSVVGIEVALIASILLGPGDFPTIGRDSIFAVMMIIMNLVMGLCLVFGAARNGEQEFNAPGATAYLSMIIVLASMALVLPMFTSATGEFTSPQAIGVGAVTAALYAIFLWRLTGSDSHFFVQPPAGSMVVQAVKALGAIRKRGAEKPVASNTHKKGIVLRSCILIAMLVPIILLAHYLAIVIDFGVAASGVPVAVGGVIIAIIVFTPESITAVKSALNNEMQRAINLCLGAFVSTVGLTVPAVLAIGLFTGKQVVMGVSAIEAVLLFATVALSMLTFNGHKTSPIQGYLHLALFVFFTVILFNP